MVTKTTSSRLRQPSLFSLEESTGRIELFPTVWNAVEDLTMPNPRLRRNALDRLIELNAPRFSPIVAYVLVTCLADTDLVFRTRVVKTLGEILVPDGDGRPAPEEVLKSLAHHLAQLRTRQVFALLQVTAGNPDLEGHVARLLDACPYAGNHLVDILSDHKLPLAIRKQAVQLIGRVGYLEALPALDRLAARLETRINGQRTMPFAPPAGSNELDLLPAVQATLAILRAP
jgi:HEAT repeat protein